MPPDETQETWQDELSVLLERAAELCSENNCHLNAFLGAASSAYFAANPEVRAHLEEMQLRAQLEQARKDGRIAQA